MGSQRPLGYATGLRRTVTPLPLPGSCLRGSSTPRLRCLRRRLTCPSAAIGFTEVLSGTWSDAEANPGFPSAVDDAEQQRLAQATGVVSHSYDQHHQAPLADSHQEQLRQRQRQQQQRETTQHLAQRLVPTASATKLPARSGVSAGGVALGILLTVALQLVGRWLQRQRWAQQLIELLDLRRSSGSSASTSGKDESGGGATAAQSPYGRSDAGLFGRGARQVSSDGGMDFGSTNMDSGSPTSGLASGRSMLLNGSGTGNLPGSPLGTMDGGVVGPGTGLGTHGMAEFVGSAAAGVAGGALLPPTAIQLPLPPGPGTDPGESVEWVNMCWRKVWRVYQRGLERWIIDLLQPVFDGLVKDGSVPRWLCRLRVVELTLDHEAPYFSNMRRRNSRKDSDLNGVVDLRYTGGARMLLMLELGEGRWRFKVPVLVSDLDLECQMWLKLRLAPMCPWIGTISLAFVGPPNVKVQLSPYNRVRLMRVPVVQNYLRKLLTVDLPALMVLPQRLEINIPPSVTTIAEAAVGRDTIMRAVASAVLQADAVEAALLAALPLGPQTPAGGVTLPEAFKGELSVTLREARNLPVWGFPGQSNPFVRLVLGEQAVQSRREGDTSHPGRHRAPVWNQEFQFLVEDPEVQVLEILVKDSHLTGRTEVGRASIKLADLLVAQNAAEGGKVSMWVPLQPPAASYGITSSEPVPTGDVLVDLTYKAFDEDEHDSGYREAENYSKQSAAHTPITDIRSAAAASSRAAVAASAAVSAIAMTRAAAARAAARAARAAQEAAAAAAGAAKGAVDQGASIIASQQQQAVTALTPPVAPLKQLPLQVASTVPSGAAAELPPKPKPLQAVQPSSGPSSPASATLERDHAAAAVVDGSSQSLPVTATDSRWLDTVVDGRDGKGDEVLPCFDVTHLPASMEAVPATASRLRTRTPTVEEEADGVNIGSKLAPPFDDTESRTHVTTPLATITQPARSATASATAVLERPATVEPHPLGDGRGGNGYPHGHYAPEGVSNGTSVPSSRWSRRPSSLSDGGGSGASYGSGPHGEISPPTALDLQFLDHPHQYGKGLTGQSPAEPWQQLQHSPEEPSLREVSKEAAVPVSSSSGVNRSSEAKPLGGASSNSEGAAGGPAGPVLGALAHLTASAQSLTATAIEKARESLSRKSQLPSGQQQQEQVQGDVVEKEGGDVNWLAALVSRLPRYGGGAHHQAHTGSGEDDRAHAAAVAPTGGNAAASGVSDDHPWWQFWVPKGGAAKLQDAESDGGAAGSAEAHASSSKSSAATEPLDGSSTDGGGKPWWQFWSGGEHDKEEEEGSRPRQGSDSNDSGSKPVEAIYIPPDLPLEEIAAEVQRLKEDSWRERSDHVSNLWMKAVERNDRKWLMLAAFLLSVAVGLLTVVAWRLEQLEHLQAVAPQIAVMTMQAALQALEQQVSSGGGGIL